MSPGSLLKNLIYKLFKNNPYNNINESTNNPYYANVVYNL